jgi:hypothetical protein
VERKVGLAPGKLPPAMMVKLLDKLRTHDPSVKLGPAMGEDAAAIRLGGGRYLISKTDPITFTAQGAPALLLQVNANDLATRGAMPRYLQVAALSAGDHRGGYPAVLRRVALRGAKTGSDNNRGPYRSDRSGDPAGVGWTHAWFRLGAPIDIDRRREAR